MKRLLSSVVLAGALAAGMSSAASAHTYDGRRGHHVHKAPVCKIVKHCEFRRTPWGRLKRVCVTKRVCRSFGHGHR